MKDRYLFKAKRVDNGEWIIGHYVNGGFIIKTNHTECINILGDTLCQCTGLKDGDDKLIWENDIVGFWDAYSTDNGQAETDCIGKVVWDDETLSFQVTNRLSAESYEVLNECSIIGNIFDNPELLKRGTYEQKTT